MFSCRDDEEVVAALGPGCRPGLDGLVAPEGVEREEQQRGADVEGQHQGGPGELHCFASAVVARTKAPG